MALVTQPGTVSESEVEKAFDRLEPIGLDTLKGEWKGFAVDTGHPGVKKNAEIKWAGKTFRSIDDVDPMVVYDEGKRLWKEDIGHARVSRYQYLRSSLEVPFAKQVCSCEISNTVVRSPQQ